MQAKKISLLVSTTLLAIIGISAPFNSLLSIQKLLAQSPINQANVDSILNTCRENLTAKQYQLALESCQEALLTYQKQKNYLGEAKSLNNLGLAYSSLLNYPKAIDSFQQSLKLAKKLRDVDLESKANINLAHTSALYGFFLISKGQYEAAINPLEQALTLSKQIKNRQLEAQTLLGLGLVYGTTGITLNISLATEYLEKSLAIAEEINDQEIQQQAKQILTLLKPATENLNKDEAVKFVQQGMEEYRADKIEASIQSWEKALNIYRKSQDYNAEMLVLGGLGDNYVAIKNYQKAIEYNQRRLIIARELKNIEQQIYALINLGFGYNLLQQYQESIKNYEEAFKIADENNNLKLKEKILSGISITYQYAGNFEKSLEYKFKQLKIVRQLGETSSEVTLLGAIAGDYYDLGKYREAIEYGQQSLTIARNIKNSEQEQSTLLDLGVFYGEIGAYSQAIEYYQKGLEIAQLSQDKQSQAIAISGLGEIYFELGEYGKAVDYLKLSLKIAREIKNIEQKKPALNQIQKTNKILRRIIDFYGEGAILSKLGDVYNRLGDYHQAIDYFKQSLALAREQHDQLAEAAHLASLGNNYRNLKDYSKAIEYYQQYLNIAKRIKTKKFDAAILISFGHLYADQRNYQKAIATYEEGLSITRKQKDRKAEGIILNAYANIYYNQQKYAKALTLFQQSLTIAKEVKDTDIEATALNNIGVTLFRTGNLSAAAEYLTSSMKVSESLQSSLGNRDNEKISFFELQRRPYHTLQKILVAQNKFESALEISERGRTRAFVDLLKQRLTEQSKDLSITANSLNIEKIKRIAKEQNATLIQYSIIYDPFKVEDKIQSLESELYIWAVQPTGKVRFRRVDLKPLWQKNNTSLEGLVPRIRVALGVRGANTNQLTFAPGDRLRFKGDKANSEPWEVVSIDLKNNTLMVIHPSFATRVPIPKPISEVEEKGETSLQQLHQILIQPIADLLPTNPKERVIFIPQGSLFLVPFAALQDPQGKYLIENHTILTAPSIQVLDLTRKQRQRLTGTAKNALVVGNPSPMPQPFQPLEYAESEAVDIAQQLGTKAIIGKDATESAIVAKMPNDRIIHLATHGQFEDTRGLGSSIALAPAGKDDGLLTAEEILNLKLNAELVVLSACDTGRGRLTGDGVIGLSRSLISAGVSSVIVSLWKVPDKTTAGLMPEFYRQLQRNPDKAQALRQAMLVTMKKHPNPGDWAGFTLIGEAE